MLNAEHTLTAVIEQLDCLNLDHAASLKDLVALNTARDLLDELFHACTAELRSDPELAPVWAAIAAGVDELSSKQRSRARDSRGYLTSTAGTAALPVDQDKRASDLVAEYWQFFKQSFVWDFLPAEFLHLLYVQWLTKQYPSDAALSRFTFARRLKTAVAFSGDWFYVRSRPGSLMAAQEPLAQFVPCWRKDASDVARYGLRRSGV